MRVPAGKWGAEHELHSKSYTDWARHWCYRAKRNELDGARLLGQSTGQRAGGSVCRHLGQCIDRRRCRSQCTCRRLQKLYHSPAVERASSSRREHRCRRCGSASDPLELSVAPRSRGGAASRADYSEATKRQVENAPSFRKTKQPRLHRGSYDRARSRHGAGDIGGGPPSERCHWGSGHWRRRRSTC